MSDKVNCVTSCVSGVQPGKQMLLLIQPTRIDVTDGPTPCAAAMFVSPLQMCGRVDLTSSVLPLGSGLGRSWEKKSLERNLRVRGQTWWKKKDEELGATMSNCPPPHTTTTGPPSKVFLYAAHLQNSDKIIILSAYILLRFPLRLHRVIIMSEVPVSGEQVWFLPPLFPSNVPLMNALFAPGAHDSTDRKDVCPKWDWHSLSNQPPPPPPPHPLHTLPPIIDMTQSGMSHISDMQLHTRSAPAVYTH